MAMTVGVCDGDGCGGVPGSPTWGGMDCVGEDRTRTDTARTVRDGGVVTMVVVVSTVAVRTEAVISGYIRARRAGIVTSIGGGTWPCGDGGDAGAMRDGVSVHGEEGFVGRWRLPDWSIHRSLRDASAPGTSWNSASMMSVVRSVRLRRMDLR